MSRDKAKLSGSAAGTLYVASGAALWGVIGLFTRRLSALGLDSIEITAVRLAGAALLMAAFFAVHGRGAFRIHLKDIWMFIGTGVLSFVFFNWCYFSCMKESSLSVAAVLLYTAPSFVMVMSALLFHERLTPVKLASLAVTMLGCVLVTDALGSGGMTARAALFGLGAGFGYALYSIFGRFALRRYPPEQVAFWTNICGGAAALCLVPWPDFALLAFRPQALGTELLLIVCSTIMPLLLYTKGLTYLETSRASILATLEPVVAAIVSVALLHEPVTWLQAAGMLLVIGAVAMVSMVGDK